MQVSFQTKRFLSGQEEVRSSLHIPMVYEKFVEEPPRWEYRVESIDPREAPLLDAAALNELGGQGWLLIGMLDERASGSGSLVHYYFARQREE